MIYVVLDQLIKALQISTTNSATLIYVVDVLKLTDDDDDIISKSLMAFFSRALMSIKSQ